MAVGSIASQDWMIGDVSIGNSALHEGCFHIEHPAKIYQIQVQYDQLPRFLDFPFEIGIYRDFGYNGFDWTRDPLWKESLSR